ncbi:hypothetical protein [Thermoactinospora rubra]|uniref:hypothetical protein n=1 Tax=Thermoactinospora rubra TaxID=1088767 RepID=UPI000A0F4784|nr:hypothetical protein [Thermoactinospora rubra]
MPFNLTSQNNALKSGTGGGIAGAITHIGVHTLTDPGTGANASAGEVSGGSPAYARQAVAWGTPGTPGPGQVSNTGALTFDIPAGSTVGFLTFWNAATGNSNNYLGYAPINGTVKGFFSVDTTLANDALLSVAHGLADGDRVQLFNTFAESLPTGLTEGALYYVVNSTANSFKVSTTSGGAPVDITALGGGEGFFQKIVPEVYASQGQLTVAAGAIVLDATGI